MTCISDEYEYHNLFIFIFEEEEKWFPEICMQRKYLWTAVNLNHELYKFIYCWLLHSF